MPVDVSGSSRAAHPDADECSGPDQCQEDVDPDQRQAGQPVDVRSLGLHLEQLTPDACHKAKDGKKHQHRGLAHGHPARHQPFKQPGRSDPACNPHQPRADPSRIGSLGSKDRAVARKLGAPLGAVLGDDGRGGGGLGRVGRRLGRL